MSARPSLSMLLLGLLLSSGAALAADLPAGTGQVRRVALCVGADDGGPERVRLRFATSDAQATCRLLGEVGGVTAADSLLLLNPSRSQLEAALAQAARVARAPGPGVSSVELVFYFSGHSSDQALLLGREQVPYPELHRMLEGVAADVRIVILDSCASGSFTRVKGGKPVAPFLLDASSRVRGQAVLTSSAATEASQESDRIHGSFFTHFLLSGLRGAADRSHDGQVSLSEAYQFAFSETLARTQSTRAGAQHPSYDMDLAGSGDVVMTDLRQFPARLVLAPELEGRLFVRDALEQLLLELNKPAGQEVELGVPEGTYTVTLDRKVETAEAQVTVAAGQTVRIERETLRRVPRELTVLRGSHPLEAELDDGFDRETPSLLARGELVVGQTVHGAAQGLLLCNQLDCSGARAEAGAAMLGGVAGAGASLLLSRHGVTPGQALAVNSGTEWGLFNGLLLESTFGWGSSAWSAAAGMGVGTLGGALLAANLRPLAGDVALVDSFGLWSSTLTVLSLAAATDGMDSRVLSGAVLGAGDVALLAGAYLARNIRVSRGHLLLIDAGGILGGLVGLGAYALLDSSPEGREFAGAAALGAAAGLGTSIYLTRDLDLPAPPGLTLLPGAAGRPGATVAVRW